MGLGLGLGFGFGLGVGVGVGLGVGLGLGLGEYMRQNVGTKCVAVHVRCTLAFIHVPYVFHMRTLLRISYSSVLAVWLVVPLY